MHICLPECMLIEKACRQYFLFRFAVRIVGRRGKHGTCTHYIVFDRRKCLKDGCRKDGIRLVEHSLSHDGVGQFDDFTG
ncbi:hypothetical protein Barb6_03526 [Bacteroidales bacterium Barb6]|nr:hypothetical protein Barb6_03526 [Bacteroidales bacterium Barb6]